MPNLIEEFCTRFWEHVEPQNIYWNSSNSVQLEIEWPQSDGTTQIESVTVSLSRATSYAGDDDQFAEREFTQDKPLTFTLRLYSLDQFHTRFEKDRRVQSTDVLGCIKLHFRVHKIKYADARERCPSGDDKFSLTWRILSPCDPDLNPPDTKHQSNYEYQEWRINGQSVFDQDDSESVLSQFAEKIQNCVNADKDVFWVYGPPGCGKSSLVYAWQSINTETSLRPVVVGLHHKDDCPLYDTEILRHKFAESVTGEQISASWLNSDLLNNRLLEAVDRAWGRRELPILILALDGFDHCLPQDGDDICKQYVYKDVYQNLNLLLSTIRRDPYKQKIKLLITDILPWKKRIEQWEKRIKQIEQIPAWHNQYDQLVNNEQICSLEFPMWQEHDIQKLISLLNPKFENYPTLLTTFAWRIHRLTGGHLSLIKVVLHNTEGLYMKELDVNHPSFSSICIPDDDIVSMIRVYQERGFLSKGAGRLLNKLLDRGSMSRLEMPPELAMYRTELEKKKDLVRLTGDKFSAIWKS